MEGLDDDLESRRQKYVLGLLIRVIVCGIFIGVFAATAYLAPPFGRPHFVAAIITLSVLMVLNYPLWVIGKRMQFPLHHFYGHWALDLFLVTLILHMLGGVELPCGFVGYMVMILTSAVLVSQRASYIVATGSAAFYDGMIALERTNILPARDQIWDHEYTLPAQVIIILASNVIFVLFAYLAGSLAQQLKRANAALAAAQSELREYNRTLEDSVRHRTRALEEKTQEIEEFVHIVTHDLRNVSIGAAEVARRLAATDATNLTPKGQRYAAALLEDTRNINRMLMHLLDLFRVDQEEGRLEWLDTRQLVGDIIAGNARRLEDKHINVTIGPLPRIYADPIQMSHVIANLVDNAIKYTGDKECAQITVDGTVGDTEYTIRVADNGIGMDPGQVGRIFQMYHRGPDQKIRGVEQQGYGVGLAITKRIVERWGGRIWVDTEVGKGSRFCFSYPRVQEERQAV